MALKYILPNFYNSFLCNKTLITKLLRKKNICGIAGSFPFSIFNGSYNNNKHEDVCLYENICSAIKDYGLLSNFIILDYGNPNIEDFDYYDLYSQVIWDEYANNTNVYFSVAHEGLLDYLVNTYPNINIILHNNYTREHTTDEIQNKINSCSNIKGIITSSFNICSKVNNVFKIYLTPLHNCEECMHYKTCLKHDHHAILEFSGISQFEECSLRELVYPELISKRIVLAEKYCDYIMFDTVLCGSQIEEYALIETVMEITEG